MRRWPSPPRVPSDPAKGLWLHPRRGELQGNAGGQEAGKLREELRADRSFQQGQVMSAVGAYNAVERFWDCCAAFTDRQLCLSVLPADPLAPSGRLASSRIDQTPRKDAPCRRYLPPSSSPRKR